MKRQVVVLLSLALAACASKPEKNLSGGVNDMANAQAEFDRGLKALDARQFDDAIQVFEQLLQSKPGTEMELVATYDIGSAREGLGECQKAGDQYRKVIRASAGKFKRIESQALFRLSLMYECLGQDTKAVTALLDTQKRGKELPEETLHAEIPARLAAAYARLNNRDKALEYFNKASRGLKGVVANKGALSKESIARTLYLMGRLSPSQKDATVDSASYLQSLSMQQPYLLQGLELANKPWSARAEDDLRTAYDNIWRFKFESEDKQRAFYTRALQTLHELRNIRLPKSDPTEDALFASLDKTEGQLQNALARAAETTPLTPEAQKREGLRRQGRLVDPKPAGKQKSSSGQ